MMEGSKPKRWDLEELRIVSSATGVIASVGGQLVKLHATSHNGLE